MRIAVLMLNLGGPETLEDVRPFLRSLFSDREIIRFPGGKLGQKLFASLIAKRKAKSSAANYEMIGGGSPLVRWTEAQGDGMCAILRREFDVELLALPCMRYWHPLSAEALQRARDWGADHIVAFSQYPHTSAATSGASLSELRRVAQRNQISTPISEITGWFANPSYVNAVAETVEAALDKLPPEAEGRTKVVYSAHSLPMKFVEAGDPYPDHVRRSVELVHARVRDVPMELCWQSKVGPVRWLEPSAVDRITALPQEAVEHVAVVPISFVNDHIETLHELDIELRELAESVGIRTFARAPALNVRARFLRALADVCGEHLAALGVSRRAECPSS